MHARRPPTAASSPPTAASSGTTRRDAGREEFRAWVRAPTDLAPQRDPFWLKVAFASPEDLPWLVELARELEAACLERMAELGEQGGGRRGSPSRGGRVAGDRPGVAAPHRGRAARRPHRGGAADPRRDEAGDPAPRAQTRPASSHPLRPTHDDAARTRADQQEPRRGRHEILVLDGVSFEVEAGELVAVFGQRAAGKTTLLRIAAGIEAPDAARPLRGRGARRGAPPPPRRHSSAHRLGRPSGPFASGMRMLDHVALPR